MGSDLAAAPATRVEVLGCAKTYAGGTVALQPTNLTVEPGEVVALLGPSGCGKTTLLRVIAGLVAPDLGGCVRFNQDDVTDRPVELRGVGMVFQHYALFPQMDVAANIGYGLRVRRLPDAQVRQRVGSLVELMRLQGLEKRRPAELSGGQRQRVALARAVAVQPRVLLLDEPLTALDAALKVALRDELAELLRRLKITALHVTHDQSEAMAIADRLAVMQTGRIVQLGDAESLYRRPGHAFVAEFLGRANRLKRSDADVAQGLLRAGGQTRACPPGLQAERELLLRPEDVQLAPAGTGADAKAGSEAATVERRVFLGERVQLRVHTGDQGQWLCDAAKDTPFQAGDRVCLIWQVNDLIPCDGI